MGRANIVVIDPHAEYLAALGDIAEVRSVAADGGLRVPYWALGLDELLRVFASPGSVDPVARNAISDLIREHREAYLRQLADPWYPPEAVTADTPTPFDMRDVWFSLDTRNRATYQDKPGEPPQEALVVEMGDPKTLTPTRFAPYSMGALPPHKGREHGHFGSVPGRILARLADPRFTFLSGTHPQGADDELPRLMGEWLGERRPVSILDFSGIPSEVADVAIGIVLSLLLEAAVHSSAASGIGRARPVLIVLEEAHRFIGPMVSSPLAQAAVERIAREGRKHGVGLMLVSQRPGELSPTAVAQCGTIIALRLTNPSDQGVVRAALPDTLAGLAELLPSLRTGEALISGEAMALPARVAIRRPSPEPRAADPSLDSWVGEPTINDLADSVKRWRGRLRGGV
jgi:DNA helicase HerA-like ATPase